jgi:hypothetical protein
VTIAAENDCDLSKRLDQPSQISIQTFGTISHETVENLPSILQISYEIGGAASLD